MFGITNENDLDIAETELSRANMMLLYENGFSDFSSNGICFIHEEITEQEEYRDPYWQDMVDVSE